jgi:hypothetical protein
LPQLGPDSVKVHSATFLYLVHMEESARVVGSAGEGVNRNRCENHSTVICTDICSHDVSRAHAKALQISSILCEYTMSFQMWCLPKFEATYARPVVASITAIHETVSFSVDNATSALVTAC